MKLKNIWTLVVTSLILMVGCTEQEFLDHSEINVSKSIIGVPFEGGSAEITLKTTADWKIVNAKMEESEDGASVNAAIPEWLTISKLSGTANAEGEKITFSADETSADRNVTLQIVVADKVQYLEVKQASASGEVVVTSAADIAAANINGKIFYVRATIKAITNTLYGNMTLEDATGSINIYGTLDANGATKNFLSLGLAVGDEILVSGPWAAQYKNLTDVTVHEIKKSLLSVDPTAVEFESKEAGSVEVTVTCKEGGLGIDIDQDWLSLSGMTPMGDDKYAITFSAGANTEIAPRNATVTFSIKGNDAVAPVSVAVKQFGDEPPVSTIADAIASEKGTMVTIEGMIMANGYNAYVVKDETGMILIYKGAYTEKARAGHKIKIVGEMGSYNHSPQIQSPIVEEYLGKDSYDHGDPVVMDATAADDFCASLKDADRNTINMEIKYVEMTGKLAVGKFTNLFIDGATTAQGSVYSVSDYQKGKLEPLNDQNVVLKGYLVQLSGGKYLNVIMSSVKAAE